MCYLPEMLIKSSRITLRIILFFGVTIFGGSCDTAVDVENNRPNIILVITDDQGIGDLGVMDNPIIQTPNIDEMAARSASIDRFYVSPACAPTRASLMTGRYNYRTRVVDTYIGRAMMEPEEVTLAEALQDGGYTTGIFGKWHLGDYYPMRPIDQGFDEALIHMGGGLAQPSEPMENEQRYTDPILFHNGEQVQMDGYCTDIYFDAALEFMEKEHKAGKPFFTYIATNAPHGPYHDVPEDLRKKYMEMDLQQVFKDPNGDVDEQKDRVARIFAMIENIDQNMGKMFGKLDEWGITDHTLVIFMVDNGPNSRRYVRELRGMKSEVFEGGIRSPFLVHWPERLKPGTTSDRIAAHIDIMPTLLDAANLPLPEGIKFDGRSVLPLLEGKETDWPDRNLFIQIHRGNEPIRYHHFAVIGQNWKLVHPTGFGREEIDPDTVPYELYNISNDPGESVNLFDEQKAKAEALLSAYDEWFSDVSSTRPNNYAPPRIVIGSDMETRTLLTAQDWRRTEGGGWGTHGYWMLEVAQPATFEVTLLMSEDHQDYIANLQAGAQRKTATFSDNPRRLSFGEIELAPGNIELEVEIRKGTDSHNGQYQVLVERK